MDDIQATFRSNLLKLRKKRGWTQEQLAEACDLSKQQIFRIEKGTSWPPPETIAKIAKALGVSQADLYDSASTAPTRDDEKEALLAGIAATVRRHFEDSRTKATAPAVPPPPPVDPKKAELIDLIDQLSPAMVGHLADIVRGFITNTPLNQKEVPTRSRRTK